MSPKQEPRKFTSEANRDMFSKIIVIYAVFYIGLKLVSVTFGEALTVPNLILALPLLLLAIWGGVQLKRKATTWLFVIVSVVVISLLRYFEVDLIAWLHNSLV